MLTQLLCVGCEFPVGFLGRVASMWVVVGCEFFVEFLGPGL